jgi:hypothetical protein
VEPYVPSTGFYRNKAKHILAVSRLLMELHRAKQPAGLAIEGSPPTTRKEIEKPIKLPISYQPTLYPWIRRTFPIRKPERIAGL